MNTKHTSLLILKSLKFSLKHYYRVLFLLIIFFLPGCNVKRFIPPGEKLYEGAELTIESDEKVKDLKVITAELESVIRPEPNSKILGARLGLLVHYKAQREKPGFINTFLNKKIGEEPVYLSDVDGEKTVEILENRFENRGFFNSRSQYVIKEKKYTAKAMYTATVEKPYRLETYQLESDSLPVHEEIEAIMPKTLLKKESRFDLALLKLERERIDQHLKSKGYYNFNADFLIFEADTNQYATKRFDTYLRLKKDVPEKALVPYQLKNIRIYPNYSIQTDSVIQDTMVLKTVQYIQKDTFFKPKRLSPYILLAENKLYNPRESKLTSNRLSSIGTYKFVNIRYQQQDTVRSPEDTAQLRVDIQLSPLKKRALRAELKAVTKSNNFAGPGLALTYSNRNLFRGGETLNISGEFGYEAQLSSNQRRGLSSTQLGLKADLIFPRLLFPIRINDQFEYAIPTTKISTGVEFLNRTQLYSLSSFNGSFGYGWRANRFVYHEFNPISVSLVNLSNTTDDFEEILDNNPFLRSSFEQQFIAGLTYSFTYSELGESNDKTPWFFQANLDVAGNTLGLLSTSTNEENGNKTFLNLEFAQYARLDADVRFRYRFTPEKTIIARLFGGWGIPYGNSVTLPFSRQYFSGGPYSVRAFQIRSLGPGTYTPSQDPDSEDQIQSFFDRSGDIRLEANLEYRFPLYGFFKGAFFIDAGNVWLKNENEALPGAQFSNTFLSELGVGAGTGMRIDVQNFVIRFDLAFPIRDPALPKGERLDIQLADPVFNFAIGYPF